MLSLPHTPQALLVRKCRCSRSMGRLIPAASATSATLAAHMVMLARSAGPLMMPSAARKPTVRSMSSPGVRMVTLSGWPATRISSGSSTASRSARGSGRAVPGAVTRSTRRLAVRPLIGGSASAPRPAPARR